MFKVSYRGHTELKAVSHIANVNHHPAARPTHQLLVLPSSPLVTSWSRWLTACMRCVVTHRRVFQAISVTMPEAIPQSFQGNMEGLPAGISQQRLRTVTPSFMRGYKRWRQLRQEILCLLFIHKVVNACDDCDWYACCKMTFWIKADPSRYFPTCWHFYTAIMLNQNVIITMVSELMPHPNVCLYVRA